MTEETGTPAESASEEHAPRKAINKTVVLLIVVALFAGVALAKLVAPKADPSVSGGPSVTTVHNDAVADYEAAKRTGRPIYILFHSLS